MLLSLLDIFKLVKKSIHKEFNNPLIEPQIKNLINLLKLIAAADFGNLVLAVDILFNNCIIDCPKQAVNEPNKIEFNN